MISQQDTLENSMDSFPSVLNTDLNTVLNTEKEKKKRKENIVKTIEKPMEELPPLPKISLSRQLALIAEQGQTLSRSERRRK